MPPLLAVSRLTHCYHLRGCDCVVRGNNPNADLYLLKGSRLGKGAMKKELDADAGRFIERDDEAIVFGMFDMHSIAFKLKDLRQKKWTELKAKRIGRLLPPFVTEFNSATPPICKDLDDRKFLVPQCLPTLQMENKRSQRRPASRHQRSPLTIRRRQRSVPGGKQLWGCSRCCR